MNPHFDPPDGDLADTLDRLPLPVRGYGLVDHIEWLGNGSVALIAIDIVDAKWMDAAGRFDVRLSLGNEVIRDAAWRASNPTGSGGNFRNPFEGAPIFTIELETSDLMQTLGLDRLPESEDSMYPSAVASLESQWLELNLFPAKSKEGTEALIYSALFTPPQAIKLVGAKLKKPTALALAKIFSLSHLPQIKTADFANLLTSKCKPDLLAVYDVGQGNANALIGRLEKKPSIYYDLGAGVYRNRHTRPSNLRFCFNNHQAIILSHWDSDHWAGTRASTYASPNQPMTSTWVVPLQVVTPKHAAFAYSIVQAGGIVFTYAPPAGSVGLAKVGNTTLAKFCVGTGPDKNGSGIVLAIERPVRPNGTSSWLLTGDCDYGFFMPLLQPATPIAIVIPHHGASAHALGAPPTPVNHYRRLVYSFGRDNKHGSTNVRHPTSSTVKAHINAGWVHTGWNPNTPGVPLPLGDTRATCEHPNGTNRGGTLIAWWAAPSLFNCSCGSNCNAPLTQI